MILNYLYEEESISWIVIGFFAAWGGVVKYLMDRQKADRKWNWVSVINQIVISSFTGLLGGLLSLDSGASHYMTLIIAGLFGAMGSRVLENLWQRFFITTGEKDG
ncbi:MULTISPECIES: phage holin family protein [Photorhabdus]|nr:MULTISPECIES: phage holin family protein [Photorhabdus]